MKLLLLLMPLSLLAAELEFINPVIRMMPPSAANTALFMEIKNTSKTEYQLVKAEASISKKVELHDHIMQDGMMSMRAVKSVALKPMKSTMLKRGGLHIMFMGLKAPLKIGQVVPVTLHFKPKMKMTVKARVSEI